MVLLLKLKLVKANTCVLGSESLWEDFRKRKIETFGLLLHAFSIFILACSRPRLGYQHPVLSSRLALPSTVPWKSSLRTNVYFDTTFSTALPSPAPAAAIISVELSVVYLLLVFPGASVTVFSGALSSLNAPIVTTRDTVPYASGCFPSAAARGPPCAPKGFSDGVATAGITTDDRPKFSPAVYLLDWVLKARSSIEDLSNFEYC